MRLDIVEAVSALNPTPSELRFEYYKGGSRTTLNIPLLTNPSDSALPAGYIRTAREGDTVYFPHPVDVAYGANGSFFYQTEVSGWVDFTNARFGDPNVGVFKSGYYRPSYPFRSTVMNGSKQVIELYPERMKAFLESIGGDPLSVNHSIVVNVDYKNSSNLGKPNIPCTDLDYGLVLKECGDLTSFTEGFSVVTNLRLYIADDFNIVKTTAPTGIADPFYPPCSLFAPEERYGNGTVDPLGVSMAGQLGSLAGGDSATATEIHLLDLKGASESDLKHENVKVNLKPITHPDALPPITMMNWLVVIEERRAEFYTSN